MVHASKAALWPNSVPTELSAGAPAEFRFELAGSNVDVVTAQSSSTTSLINVIVEIGSTTD
jgi:hypothetical protein